MTFTKQSILCCLIVVSIIFIYGCRKEASKPEDSASVTDNIEATAPTISVYEAEGQVRNNKIDLSEKLFTKLFWNDPVFKDFQDTGKTLKEYEKQLVGEAKGKGIDEENLIKSLSVAKTLKGENTAMYPVVIETAKYNGTDCFIFILTWEYLKSVNESDIVKPLGHIYITAIEAATQQVLMEDGCM